MMWTWKVETRPRGDMSISGETVGNLAAAIRHIELEMIAERWDNRTDPVSIHLLPHCEAE